MFDSIVRTLTVLIVGTIITALARVGLHPSAGAVAVYVAPVVGIVGGVVYHWLARVVEQRWPGASRWLLGLGVFRVGRPVYRRGS